MLLQYSKKDDRQIKSSYRLVSLLNAFSKIIEKVVFTRVYNFLLDINFLNPLQSGFRPGDSTVNQLVYMHGTQNQRCLRTRQIS